MMSNLGKFAAMALAGTIVFTSCSNDERLLGGQITEDGSTPTIIKLGGDIGQEYKTRVSDTGFCDGDKIGIYIVDYDGAQPGVLENKGNRADNVRFVFDEKSYHWVPAYDIYWKDKTTHIDIYGYYPYTEVADVNKFMFEVQKDQSRAAEGVNLSSYEASDLLWGKSADNAPTDRTIMVRFNHILASARVSLIEGEGWSDGEWVDAEKAVIMLNTTRTSEVDLSTGSVTATGSAAATGTVPYFYNGDYRSIVIPQTVPAGRAVLSATVAGKAYNLVKQEDFTYVSGKQHNFTITVNKRADGDVEFVLAGESITVWENDNVSHDATAREYAVVNIDVPGTLDACLTASGKDLDKVRNLKITGTINSRDFAVMKYMMSYLTAVNLKEVKIVASEPGDLKNDGTCYYNSGVDGEIPAGAMNDKHSLTSIVLPDELKIINDEAFCQCYNLSGSLIIPEGVTEIGVGAFRDCKNLTGTLSLPSTLKRIGKALAYDPYWSGTFYGCGFVCELKLPDGLEEIGMGAFNACHGLHGELRLPESLKVIGPGAFSGCNDLHGSITIPQGVTMIPGGCFEGSGLNGTLSLHDGIVSIGENAFANTNLKGELRLPKYLEVLSSGVFYNCDFTGDLILPSTLKTIGDKAFAYNWRLYGHIEIPEGVLTIGAGAFAKTGISGVTFPESLESIRYEPSYYEDGGAFQDCFYIGRVICKGTIPPYMQDGSFNGVPKDNFTLEVPESAVQQYQAAEGWKEFKRISAYRNLVIRPSIATAINTSVTRDLVLTAESDWELVSKPEWVSLDKTSGDGKCELKLTFSEMSSNPEGRSGEVVFKLKDKDYTTTCYVSQYDYNHAEDEFICLQNHTKGDGIPIVILGDGFNAKDIHEGKLLDSVTEAYGHYFSIEPYKTYQDYFDVYTAVSVSAESGIGSVNTIVYNRFNTSFKGGVALSGRNGESDFNEIFKYAMDAPCLNNENLNEALIIMIPNTKDYGGICYMYDNGSAIAYCPMSDYGYPLDFRGTIQHEAGGHGFGKLGDEYIYHNAFIDNCDCVCCGHVFEFNTAKAKGWYDNLSLTGKMNEVPWSHLIFHEKYRNVVDIFEGGYMHSRGVYRSEQNSCMNNDIPYYSTISRESIVKRIMAYAGEEYSFDAFVENDRIEAATATQTKSGFAEIPLSFNSNSAAMYQHEPVFVGPKPVL